MTRLSPVVTAGCLCLLLLAAAPALAASIEQALADIEDGWLRYEVPIVEDAEKFCCFDTATGEAGCRLGDEDRSYFSRDRGEVGPGDGSLQVFVRVDGGEVERIASFSDDCPVDVAGERVVELERVSSADSIAWLEALAGDRRSGDLEEQALAALAHHRDDEARLGLIRLASPPGPSSRREQAVFWLGAARGSRALTPLREILEEDPSRKVRAHAVFAISLIDDDPRATELLFALAREAKDPEVRSTAVFWVAQQAGDRVEETLSSAIDDDPDLEVKQQAIFALSQLPPERGVPRLLELARDDGRHPELRRTAMFWLGQSDDPRALELFEQILLEQ